MRRYLTPLVEQGEITARERAQAGDVLGRLGDPRFDPDLCYLPRLYRGETESRLGFIEIPRGPFVMGSRQGDKEAYDDEFGNPDSLSIDYPYWIARYPVTVGQFSVFVEAEAYTERQWWTEPGRAWRDKEQPIYPRYWKEQQAHPNRPVMGVSWFEAWAYCRWLEAQLRQCGQFPFPEDYALRLPTEAEWEKAARQGDGRRYPWGDEDWDEERANIHQSEIGRPTAVGMYPQGATLAELHDASGNVLEWTLSQFRDYPYQPGEGRNDLEAEEAPVVRGGSWFGDQWGARCAFRYRNPPDVADDNLGFRVVVSLANSEF